MDNRATGANPTHRHHIFNYCILVDGRGKESGTTRRGSIHKATIVSMDANRLLN